MSQNNDTQKPIEVQKIEREAARPKVDTDKLKASVKQKNDAINQNQIVRK